MSQPASAKRSARPARKIAPNSPISTRVTTGFSWPRWVTLWGLDTGAQKTRGKPSCTPDPALGEAGEPPESDQLPAQRLDDRLSPGAGLEFPLNAGDHAFDRPFRPSERAGDLPDGGAVGQHAQHLEAPLVEVGRQRP